MLGIATAALPMLKSWRVWLLIGLVIAGLGLVTYITALKNEALEWENKFNEQLVQHTQAVGVFETNELKLRNSITKQNAAMDRLRGNLKLAEAAVQFNIDNLNKVTKVYDRRIEGLMGVAVENSCEGAIQYLREEAKDIRWEN